jgi:SAM-dependent methyltransferase
VISRRPEEYSFIRYLEAKRAVDDRALNQQVWHRLVDELETPPSEQPLRVVEVGAGVGTMVERLVEWGISIDLDYTAVDSDPSLLDRASRRLPEWAENREWRAKRLEQDRLILDGGDQRIALEFLAGDIFDMAQGKRRGWDLMLAHAFLDLVNLEVAIPCLFALLRPGGLFYFTLVFDGATILRPAIDPPFDSRVEACYHQSMKGRTVRGEPTGHSQSGRMLLETLARQHVPVLAAGSSDWVVYPPYDRDEAYFLHYILHFMKESLRGCRDLEPRRVDAWLATRHRQVEEEGLIYIAHQLDVLGHLADR